MSYTVDSAGYVETRIAASTLGVSTNNLARIRRSRPELFPNVRRINYREYEYKLSDVQEARKIIARENKTKGLRGERFIEYRKASGMSY